MLRFLLTVVAAALLGSWSPVSAQEQLEFESTDGLKMTADFYGDESDKQRPLICLFHQAGWSRGEYREIAPKLVKMGFNCLAVDSRSGGEINDVVNETAKRSTAAGDDAGRDFMKAYPDIVAALKYAKEQLTEGKLIAWGSSYSASLVLKASMDNPELVDGTLSFAPNANAGWTKPWMLEGAGKLAHPVFITSMRQERKNWQAIYDALPAATRSFYLPSTIGNHGSRALWAEFDDHAGYWEAVTKFLEAHFLNPVAS